MAAPLKIYEKLGAFYLGRRFDLRQDKLTDDLVLYDSKDLVTHAVLVGMTGSGKTGLGITLLEEAAIDQIPALVIDPKGDMSNLLLNFPDLRPDEFLPWINPDDARRAGTTADAFARQQAAQWKQGLADWDQDGERIRYLRESADFTIYTPGSDAGVPISILASFGLPPKSVLDESDLLRDRVATTATSLLSLLGIKADPVRSREHILLTTIFDHCWRHGQNLDLGAIIRLVQNPPVERIGVMDIESFFPSKERFDMAMTINNLLAAPGFASWMSGEPLDVDRLLYTSAGKPRISILSIAHLSEPERLFFVSLLLNQTIGWMRTRPGTTSLRALLYIDEIFGYMPPVAEPPTKKPLLTLLKQARAFGLGCVLATQNPMDLDYKGLSNTGTWFIGRLQTDRDKERVLDGLEGATNESGGAFHRAEMSEILSHVGKRVFLMHNVHESSPVVFQSRWALSYLSGPMTRGQIKQLMAGRQPSVADPFAPRTESAGSLNKAAARPVLPPDINQIFLPIHRHVGDQTIVYKPHVMGIAKVHFVDSRKGLSADRELTLLAPLRENQLGVEWSEAEQVPLAYDELLRDANPAAAFGKLPSHAGQAKSYRDWEKALDEFLYRSQRFDLQKSNVLNELSQAGEAEREFRIRLNEKARVLRDDALEQLRRKYASKLRTAAERVERAEDKVEVERQEAEGAKMQTAISWGATILGAVLGRKIGVGTVGRAATAARGMGRSRKAADDVSRAEEQRDRYSQQREELEAEIAKEEAIITERFDPLQEQLELIQLKPRRSDINIRYLALAWAPYLLHDDGTAEPLYQ